MGAVVNAPIVIDIGKTSRKKIRDLEKGCGPIVTDVQDAVTEVTTSLGEQAEGIEFVPLDSGELTGAERGRWAAERAAAGF